MKNLLFILLLTVLYITAFSQQYDFREYDDNAISAELFIPSTGNTLATDTYSLQLDDNIGADQSSLFQASLLFHSNEFPNFEKDSTLIALNDTGIIRLKIYDAKLYGYVRVNQLHFTAIGLIVNIVGIKNVPQRKKLLFRDSSRLRMWDHPWIK